MGAGLGSWEGPLSCRLSHRGPQSLLLWTQDHSRCRNINPRLTMTYVLTMNHSLQPRNADILKFSNPRHGVITYKEGRLCVSPIPKRKEGIEITMTGN